MSRSRRPASNVGPWRPGWAARQTRTRRSIPGPRRPAGGSRLPRTGLCQPPASAAERLSPGRRAAGGGLGELAPARRRRGEGRAVGGQVHDPAARRRPVADAHARRWRLGERDPVAAGLRRLRRGEVQSSGKFERLCGLPSSNPLWGGPRRAWSTVPGSLEVGGQHRAVRPANDERRIEFCCGRLRGSGSRWSRDADAPD